MNRDYFCDFRKRGCQYSSTYKSNAKKHSKNSCSFRNHAERAEAMNTCAECGLVSANRESFKNHVENCLGIVQPQHECDVCNIKFTTLQKLRNHKRAKHYWECKLCTRRIEDIFVSINFFSNFILLILFYTFR